MGMEVSFVFFFFNDTAPTELYTLSLHDALPIYRPGRPSPMQHEWQGSYFDGQTAVDRKSTRLNSSHVSISYAVFCSKKKTKYAPLPGYETKKVSIMYPQLSILDY